MPRGSSRPRAETQARASRQWTQRWKLAVTWAIRGSVSRFSGFRLTIDVNSAKAVVSDDDERKSVGFVREPDGWRMQLFD